MASTPPARRPVSRRAVTSGIAWSAPAVAGVVASPAFAASCTPSLSYDAGIHYHWGTVSDKKNATTNQVMQLGAGAITVNNLPTGVTVETIVVDEYIHRRSDQAPRGPGAWFPSHSTVFTGDIGWSGSDTSGTLTPKRPTQNTAVRDSEGNYKAFDVTVAYPVARSGWDPTIVATNNLTVDFKDGTAPGWRLRYSWKKSSDSVATYTDDAQKCRTFDSKPSGRFNINYRNVQAALPSDWWTLDMAPAARSDITVTLSDKTTLTGTAYSGGRTV